MGTKKIYVVWGGDYVQSCDKEYCSWTATAICAKHFSTYAKAYAFMKKVNKYYGYNRCCVCSLKDYEYQPYWWDVMLKDIA